MADRIRWGIIGCGDVTEKKSGPAFQKAKGSELVAVMRRDAAKAEDYARRHGVKKWYSDPYALIEDPEVDAVYIATPPDSHCNYTLLVAQAGKPVYVEKPMARHYDECLRMLEECTEAGVPLFVAYYRRKLPNFLKVKELIEDGAIGEVRFVQIELIQSVREKDFSPGENWRVNPNQSGGGYFHDLASHQLDYLDYVFGPILNAKGFTANQAGLYPASDIVTASFYFENGVQGSGIWSFASSNAAEKEQMAFVGSKGKITMSTFSPTPVILENEKGKKEFTFDMPDHIQQPLIQSIVDELLGHDKCPSKGFSAARTSRVLDLIAR